jgi:hypothetical protein
VRTIFLLYTLFLLSSLSFSQEIDVSLGVNLHRNPSKTLFTKTTRGASTMVAFNWTMLDSVQFRLTLAQENFTSNLSTTGITECILNETWISAEVSNVAVILYPLNYNIKDFLDVNLGVQFSTPIRSKVHGCSYVHVSLVDFNIDHEHAKDAYYGNLIGVNVRLGFHLKITDSWKLNTDYVAYATPMEEFSGWIIGGATLRQYFGLGLSYQFTFKATEKS